MKARQPSEESLRSLRSMLDAFVDGRARTKEHVDNIEALLIREFMGTDIFEDLTVPVASYAPGGGEYLYDEEALARVFQGVLPRISDE